MVRISPGAMAPGAELAAFTIAAILGRAGAVTVTPKVARLDDVMPSHAARVKLSLPSKSVFGNRVATVPFTATVPLAGWSITERVRAFLSASVAAMLTGAGIPGA